MPTTKLDNRMRIPPELWKRFLDACAEVNMDYHSVAVALLTYFCLYRELPHKSSGNTYYAPSPIPDIRNVPVTSSSVVNELLSDDLFS